MKKPIQSMTGFASIEGKIDRSPMRLEIKSLNHRFLDLKLRVPREFMVIENQIRTEIQSQFQRGALDMSLRWTTDDQEISTQYELNVESAKSYLKAVAELQKKLKLKGKVGIQDLLGRGDFIRSGSTAEDFDAEKTWKELQPLLAKLAAQLTESRVKEGEHLIEKVFKPTLKFMKDSMNRIGSLREAGQGLYKEKIKTKMQNLFETYSVLDQGTQAVLETRVSQELALLLDRTDVEEERVRFAKHLSHLEKVLEEPGPIGRKTDFILQELGREINTLGNKAQDVAISEEVVQVKVKLEQLREQGLNIE